MVVKISDIADKFFCNSIRITLDQKSDFQSVLFSLIEEKMNSVIGILIGLHQDEIINPIPASRNHANCRANVIGFWAL